MSRYSNLNPYELHKLLINNYLLKKPGDTDLLIQRDTRNDKTDLDIIRENHKFIWDDDNPADTWEKQLARKYYEKLFKEYCITDLSLYKRNKIALRWRVTAEVISGKGQFICGHKICAKEANLKTWEVNFLYTENNVRKNALVKLRLCQSCSEMLNYNSQKREVIQTKRLINKLRKSKRCTTPPRNKLLAQPEPSTSTGVTFNKDATNLNANENNTDKLEEQCWRDKPQEMAELKSREEEFDEYLVTLLL